MKIRVVSDIHLEHRASNSDKSGTLKALNAAIPEHSFDQDSLLVLAGDITSESSQRKWALEDLASRFDQVLYVPGNHEHYGGYIDNWNLYEAGIHGQNKNVRVAHIGYANQSLFVKEKLTVISATMWAPYGEKNPVYANALHGTSDVRWIQDASVKSLQRLHRDEIDMLREFLKAERKAQLEDDQNKCRVVVVTHHVPSLGLRHPDYPASYMDDMFMAHEACEMMFKDYAPDLWVFGHTHKSWDIQIGKTRCVSNPYGYPGESYQGWQKAKYV